MSLQEQVKILFKSQIQEWELAKNNYDGLKHVRTKVLDSKVFRLEVQYNPNRIVSSAAKVDKHSIGVRPCFLCEKNRPKEQKALAFKKEYLVLVNPFPIFKEHLTIPSITHTEQLISGRIGDMLDLSKELEDYVIFYNGAKCGASAPDHFHFQAGLKGILPLENEIERSETKTEIAEYRTAKAASLEGFERGLIYLCCENRNDLATLFEIVYNKLSESQGKMLEPMLNILSWFENRKWTVLVFPRKLHRPWQFAAQNDDQILLSPASVDMAGLLITPREEDYNKIQFTDLIDIYNQVCLTQKEILKLF